MTGRSLVAVVLMWLAAALSVWLVPVPVERSAQDKIELKRLFPTRLGPWQEDTSIIPIQPAPDVQAGLERIFSQILSRTYVDDRGRRIMLSVVYGDGIDRQLDTHRPEICYPAQGFTISKYFNETVAAGERTLPVRRMVARMGARNEPITYWTVIGGSVMSNTATRKLMKVVHGLGGRLEDGMLVRISSIDSDQEAAFQLQTQFIQAVASHARAESRTAVFGRL